MNKNEFNFILPENLIAQTPLKKRDDSRLMCVNIEDGSINHKKFSDIKSFFKKGDCLVLNDSRVIPARLIGTKGLATVEVFLLRDMGDKVWECLVRPGKKLKEGAEISFGDGVLLGSIIRVCEKSGNRFIKFEYDGIFLEILEKLGEMPLPHYIKEKLSDNERYQTVYSKTLGSCAAPTAGLHFTSGLLQEIESLGVNIAYVTLHVGLGTFRPVKVDNISEHQMHSEYYSLDEQNANIINNAKALGGRVISVGTTANRVIETIADENGYLKAQSGDTDIFITPGYKFKIVDILITNFHLPESTLIMLVCAFAGKKLVMDAYSLAISEEYRFFSFGDSMIIGKL